MLHARVGALAWALGVGPLGWRPWGGGLGVGPLAWALGVGALGWGPWGGALGVEALGWGPWGGGLGTRLQPNGIHSGPLKHLGQRDFSRLRPSIRMRLMVIAAVQKSFSSMSCLRGESCGAQALI